jgi:hypothetical protein
MTASMKRRIFTAEDRLIQRIDESSALELELYALDDYDEDQAARAISVMFPYTLPQAVQVVQSHRQRRIA